jgi:enamine deaminase RidA (YjgF/YER057c/UK114 family)
MFCRSLVVLFLALITLDGRAADVPVREVRPDDATETSMAVVVDGAANLAFTEQIMPVGADDKVIAPGRVDEQVGAVLDRLESTLKDANSGLERLVKVDVYVARPDAIAAFQKSFARRIAGKARPAASFVVGALSRAEALVAIDAIAVTSVSGVKPGGRFAILPVGPKAFVSGQADPDADLALATRKTLEGLSATLKFVGSDRSQVVRLKAFMQPMTAASRAAIEREVSAFFGGKDVPPLSLVEWRSSPNQPIEIEVVAASREAVDVPVEYLTPPALKASPLFSRVARVNEGPVIYVSGLYGLSATTGAAQVETIFDKLAAVLSEAGSDFRHLAKATYYVSDEAASRALNDLRPRYFDPKRPPAASKAFVAGVGLEQRTVTLDMIAVPTAR